MFLCESEVPSLWQGSSVSAGMDLLLWKQFFATDVLLAPLWLRAMSIHVC
jgi:hypothetical protein